MANCFEYRGYHLVQETKINHHYSIYDSEGTFCLHASYEGNLFTQKEAEKAIDDYLKLVGII